MVDEVDDWGRRLQDNDLTPSVAEILGVKTPGLAKGRSAALSVAAALSTHGSICLVLVGGRVVESWRYQFSSHWS